ncbi:cyclic nucleotide-binding domain-containing protein [Deltaproteobacteria bacterium TL4]
MAKKPSEFLVLEHHRLPDELQDIFQQFKDSLTQHTELFSDDTKLKLENVLDRYMSALSQMIYVHEFRKTYPTPKQSRRVMLLKTLPLFKTLHASDLIMMANQMQEQTVRPGVNLLTQDRAADGVYFLEEGEVEILVNGELVAHRGRNECFGEMSCLRGEPNASATVRTLMFSRVLKIQREQFLKTVSKTPLLWQHLFQETTSRFQATNRRLSEVLQHTPHGLVKVDADSKITTEFSIECTRYFKTSKLAGKDFSGLIFVNNPVAKDEWIQVYPLIYEDTLMDFNQLADLLPKGTVLFGPDKSEQHFVFSYYPCRDAQNKVIAVDVGIEDVTEKWKLARKSEALEMEREVMKKMYDNPDAFINVLGLAKETLEKLSTFEHWIQSDRSISPEQLVGLMRQLHSLKGSSGMFALHEMKDTSHALEECLKNLNPKQALAPFDLSDFQELKRDLVIHCEQAHHYLQNLSEELRSRLTGIVLKNQHLAEMKEAASNQNWPRLQYLLQEIEKVPLRKLVQTWPDEIQRLCEKLGKNIEFKFTDNEINISKALFETLNAPLVHVLRNAVDHGIEDPMQRIQHGKEERGIISFNAYLEKELLILEISDDGKGVNYEKIIEKCRMNQHIDQNLVEQHIAHKEAWKLLFIPGFSTAEQVTSISGRGVGMDAIQEAVHSLKGSAYVETILGQGSTFRFKIPL